MLLELCTSSYLCYVLFRCSITVSLLKIGSMSLWSDKFAQDSFRYFCIVLVLQIILIPVDCRHICFCFSKFRSCICIFEAGMKFLIPFSEWIFLGQTKARKEYSYMALFSYLPKGSTNFAGLFGHVLIYVSEDWLTQQFHFWPVALKSQNKISISCPTLSFLSFVFVRPGTCWYTKNY